MKKNTIKITTAAITGAALAGLITGSAYASTPLSSGINNPFQSSHLIAGAQAYGAVSEADEHGDKGSCKGKDGCKGSHDCKGHNECKGKGGCKSGDNGCKGKNSCKGKGGCKTEAEAKH